MSKKDDAPVTEDVQEQPTEVKGKMITPDEVSDWGNEKVMIEPNTKNEAGEETHSEEPVEEETEEPDEEEQEELEVPEAKVTVDDPGEYQPKDYSFEVTLKDGKTKKIDTVEAWDELLDSDPEFPNAGLLLKYQRQATKMESKLERDQEVYQEKKDKFEQSKAEAEAINASTQQLVREVEYLVDREDLPAIPKKFQAVDWSSDEAARKDPAVKTHLKLINYRERENKVRYAKGLTPMSMLDAFTAMQFDDSKKRSQEVKDRAGELRKEAGARIAGSSPAPVTSRNPVPGIAVGQGGSLREMNAGWGQ